MPSAGDSVADTSKAVIFPVNGPTIGHIVDGAYVPIAPDAIPSISYSDVAMKDWAGYWLAERGFSDMLPSWRPCIPLTTP